LIHRNKTACRLNTVVLHRKQVTIVLLKTLNPALDAMFREPLLAVEGVGC
jgi:hypothetical protein